MLIATQEQALPS